MSTLDHQIDYKLQENQLALKRLFGGDFLIQ